MGGQHGDPEHAECLLHEWRQRTGGHQEQPRSEPWRLRNVFGPDEYVGAAVQIYLDLLNIFMAILRVMGNRRN